MIAKRIERGAGRPSSYGKLARYVVDARGRADPASWLRTTDYILDSEHEGAKVAGIRITNCAGDEPAMAALEILATQGQNTRSKKDKTYHLVVSFATGENPSLATIHAIEDSLCDAIGLGGHQRISAIHADTEHLHVHIAINKVNPTTLRNVEPYYDKARLMEACSRLEQEHGLVRTNHGLERDLTQKRDSQERQHHERADPIHERDPRERDFLRQSYHAALGEEPQAESLDTVRSLSSVGLVCDPEANAVLLSGHASDELAGRRAERDDALRWVRDGDGGSRGENARSSRGVNGRAGDLEAHTGRESLVGWIKRELAPALAGAGTWEAFHETLAQHGLGIAPRGAGLVVQTNDGKLAIKPSSIGREFSSRALEVRLGEFRQGTGNARAKATGAGYAAQPKQQGTTNLFAQFQRERDGALEARKNARAQLRDAHVRYKADLADYYARKRNAVRTSRARSADKMAAYRSMAAERAADWTKQRDLERRQREAIGIANPLPVWQDWLTARAAAGDTTAIAALRSRATKMDRLVEGLFGRDRARAMHAVRAELRPKADKHGTMHYELQDGGRVRDTAGAIAVDQRTDAAAALAVVLAAERFGGQALEVEGSQGFRSQVARIAGSRGLAMVFADASLEAIRQAASPAKPAEVTSVPASHTAIEALVEARNADRTRITSIPEHRAWNSGDAGTVVYEGKRALRDGTQALLLKKDAMMLVMQATPAQAAMASTWKKGQALRVEPNGRLDLHRETKRGPKR